MSASKIIAEAPAPSGAFRDEASARLATLEEKLVGLAEAMPEDSYTWRPGDGVRSTAEVFTHIAGANFGIAGSFGAAAPEGAAPGSDVTDKAAVVEALKASFDHIKGAVGGVAAGSADETMNMFGREMTTRQALWTMNGHLSEHLGQVIAYARVNGVVPPWNAQ